MNIQILQNSNTVVINVEVSHLQKRAVCLRPRNSALKWTINGLLGLLTQIWRPWPRYVEARPHTEAAHWPDWAQTGSVSPDLVTSSSLLPPLQSLAQVTRSWLGLVWDNDDTRLAKECQVCRSDDTNHNMLGICRLRIKPTFLQVRIFCIHFNKAF